MSVNEEKPRKLPHLECHPLSSMRVKIELLTAARRGIEESVVWSGSRRSSGRKVVEQVGGGVEALSPDAQGERSLDQKGAHDVVRCVNHPLSLAVLRRGIRTRHTQLNTPR